MRRFGDLLKWLSRDYTDEWTWRRAWELQIRSAVADRTMEDSLVKDMRDSLEDGSLLPEECARLLIEWESKRSKLVEQRLLVDLYTLLERCTIDTALGLLNCLAAASETFRDRDNRNEAFVRLCRGMADVLRNADPKVGPDALIEAVGNTEAILFNLGDQQIGIAGALELYDFYSRVHRFLLALKKARRGSLHELMPRREHLNEMRITCLEAAHRWLDRFVTGEVRKDVKDISPALLWFYLQQAEMALKWEFTGTVVERSLCRRAVDQARTHCQRLVPEYSLVAWLSADVDEILYFIANLGGAPAPDVPIRILNQANTSELLFSLDIQAFDEYNGRLEAAFLRPGENTLLIRQPDKASILGEHTLYRHLDDSSRKAINVEQLRYKHQYDPDPELQNWVYKPDWWDGIKESLGDKGRIKVVYGLPRVGKTTGLMHVCEDLTRGRCTIPVYINLETLLPGDDSDERLLGLREAMLRRDIADRADHVLAARLEWKAPRNPGDLSAAEYSGYLDQLAALLNSHSARLLVLIDEWSVLWELHPRLAEAVLAIIGEIARPPLSTLSAQFVLSATGLIDRELVGKVNLMPREGLYMSMAETDPSLIAAAPFGAGQIGQVLSDWLRGESLHEPCYDDLAIELVAGYTGGHPLLLQIFAQHVIRALRIGVLALPISWHDVERMWTPLLSDPDDLERYDDFVRFRMDMYGALETIWLGLSDSEQGTNDRHKLRQVLEGRSWSHLQQMLDCGLVRLDQRQRPVLGIGALEPWYEKWCAEQGE